MGQNRVPRIRRVLGGTLAQYADCRAVACNDFDAANCEPTGFGATNGADHVSLPEYVATTGGTGHLTPSLAFKRHFAHFDAKGN
jgi:hypothetical protein